MRYCNYIATMIVVLSAFAPASAADQPEATVKELRNACLSDEQHLIDACRMLLASYSMRRVMQAQLDQSKTTPKTTPTCQFLTTVDPAVEAFLLWSDPVEHPERQSIGAEVGAMDALDSKYPCKPQ